MTAACGAGIAFAPVPGIGTAGLVTAEVALIYSIGKIYGVDLSRTDVAIIASTLGIGSAALRVPVVEICNYFPFIGWAVKATIAAITIESVGAAAIAYFEQKYPGKIFSADS
jgi:uncharacterized protein (DUF697 family)